MGTQSTSGPTSTLAIFSIIAGIASWFIIPTIGAIIAIITGHMARREIQNSYGALSGDGLAMIGLVLGYLNLILSCLGILFAVLVFGGLIGLSGCAILADSASLLPVDGSVIPPLP